MCSAIRSPLRWPRRKSVRGLRTDRRWPLRRPGSPGSRSSRCGKWARNHGIANWQNRADPPAICACFDPLLPAFPTPSRAQAVASPRFWVKHSRHSTGRPWVGRNGTVVALPHAEQLARVSTLPVVRAFPADGGGLNTETRLVLQFLQRLGSLRNCLSWKKSCSPAVKIKVSPQSTQVSTLS